MDHVAFHLNEEKMDISDFESFENIMRMRVVLGHTRVGIKS